MNYLKIYFFIFLTILNIFCFSDIKKLGKNNNKFLNNNKRIRKSVEFQSIQDKLYNNFNNEQKYRKKRMTVSWLYTKWDSPIPYFVDDGVNHNIVDSALYIIQKKTCISFVKYQKMIPGISGLRYFYGDGCYSPLGQPTSKVWQNISIGKTCTSIESVQHETMHSLGFYHVQSRYDRDKYLSVLKENIIPSQHNKFEKVSKLNSRTFGVSFDMGSVLMYKADLFAKNGKKSMIPHDSNYARTIGYAKRVTFNDVKIINMYYCGNKCSNKINCMNGGYQDPNNCNICKCVKGFTGGWCQFLIPPVRDCGESIIIVKDNIKFFQLSGKKKCIYHFFCDKRKRVAFNIIQSKFFPNGKNGCFKDNSLEVKYWEYKASTGARFCLNDKNVLIVTHNNHGILHFRSSSPRNHFKLLFKSIINNYNENDLKKEFLQEKIRLNL